MIVSFAVPAGAVVDIGPVEVGEDPGVSGNLSGSYVAKSGNTDKEEYDLGFKLQYDTNRRSVAFIQGSYERTLASDAVTEDEQFSHARYLQLLHAPTLYGEVFSQRWQNKFQSIDHRWLFGANLRWRFLAIESWGKLYLGLGTFREDVGYVAGQPDPNEVTTRFNGYLVYSHDLSERTALHLAGYYQPAWDDADDRYTSFLAELEIQVWADLHLSLLYELDYDSRPPTGILSEDREFSTSLVWKF